MQVVLLAEPCCSPEFCHCQALAQGPWADPGRTTMCLKKHTVYHTISHIKCGRLPLRWLQGGQKHPLIVSSNFTIIENKNDNASCPAITPTASACRIETTSTSSRVSQMPISVLRPMISPEHENKPSSTWQGKNACNTIWLSNTHNIIFLQGSAVVPIKKQKSGPRSYAHKRQSWCQF